MMIAPALLASTAIILLSFVSEDAATISSDIGVYVCRRPRDPSLRVDRGDVRADENACPPGIRRCALHPQISRNSTKGRVMPIYDDCACSPCFNRDHPAELRL